MTTPPPASPSPAKEPLAVQAAKFSLYAPIVAVFLGFLSTTMKLDAARDSVTSRGVASGQAVIGIVNMVLIALGFIAGIYALACIKKVGKRGILWRSVFGLSINSVLIVGTIWLFLFNPYKTLSARYVGHWRATSPAVIADKFDMQLSPGGVGQITLNFAGTQQISGKWGLAFDKDQPAQKSLFFKFDSPTAIGPQTAEGMRWEIERLDENILTLRGNHGVETYARIQP